MALMLNVQKFNRGNSNKYENNLNLFLKKSHLHNDNLQIKMNLKLNVIL